ncbi:MAG: transposase [Actinomycetota bacterium]|nr:transposase [Actinomycetota bacterium]
MQVGHRKLVITVETGAGVTGCPRCGVVATGHGRRRVEAADVPCFGVAVLLVWLKRIWRCAEPGCPQLTWSEQHELIAPRAVRTSRAIGWAVDALADDDTTVSALARHLRVGWHTLWPAITTEAAARISRPERLQGVRTLGVDEHIWRPGRYRANRRAVTAMVDLTRDAGGRLHARLLDVAPGRSGAVYAGWLGQQGTSSSPASSTPPWTRSVAMPTQSATSSPTPSPSSTPFTSSGSAPRFSTRSAAESSKTPCNAAGTAMTRSTRSGGCCVTARRT